MERPMLFGLFAASGAALLRETESFRLSVNSLKQRLSEIEQILGIFPLEGAIVGPVVAVFPYARRQIMQFRRQSTRREEPFEPESQLVADVPIEALDLFLWKHRFSRKIDCQAEHCACRVPALYRMASRGLIKDIAYRCWSKIWRRQLSSVFKTDKSVDSEKIVERAFKQMWLPNVAHISERNLALSQNEVGRLVTFSADAEGFEAVKPAILNVYAKRVGHIKSHLLRAASRAIGYNYGHFSPHKLIWRQPANSVCSCRGGDV